MKLYFHVLTQRDVHVIWMPANLTHFVLSHPGRTRKKTIVVCCYGKQVN